LCMTGAPSQPGSSGSGEEEHESNRSERISHDHLTVRVQLTMDGLD
jgi:hypothetical protein